MRIDFSTLVLLSVFIFHSFVHAADSEPAKANSALEQYASMKKVLLAAGKAKLAKVEGSVATLADGQASAYIKDGKFKQAAQVTKEDLAAFAKAYPDKPYLHAYFNVALARIHSDMGKYKEALGFIQTAVTQSKKHPNFSSIEPGLSTWGFYPAVYTGDYAAALQDTEDFAKAGAPKMMLSWKDHMLAVYHWRRGEFDRAESVAREALRYYAEAGGKDANVGWHYLRLVQVLRAKGKLTEAKAQGLAALKALSTLQPPKEFTNYWMHKEMAAVCALQKDLDCAGKYSASAASFLSESDMKAEFEGLLALWVRYGEYLKTPTPAKLAEVNAALEKSTKDFSAEYPDIADIQAALKR